ncbi:Kdo hydroxylase family protein [soil metagenome]
MVQFLSLDSDLGPAPERARAAGVLEGGGLILLPQTPFEVLASERDLIDPAVLTPKSKNVSLDPASGEVGGSSVEGERREAMRAMIARYADFAEGLIGEILPGYSGALQRRRTSFRPGAVDTRALSPRKDDRRLHVDAFPSSPVQGRRILRVFSNVDPMGRDRVWEVGNDDFETFARSLSGRLQGRSETVRGLMQALKITRGRRTAYDQAMLELHDGAKLDDAWQAAAPRTRLAFPAGSSWIVYTDGSLHAALSGQHAFEQTYLLPVEAMYHPERSPLRALERVTGRALV